MWDDIAVAVNRIWRARASSAIVVVLLAVAIAISASVTCVAYALLWKPLPYASADRLVQLHGYAERMGTELGWAVPFLDAVARDGTALDSVSAYRRTETELTDGAGRSAGVANVVYAEPALLRLLGARIQLGRAFSAEDAKPGADAVAVISPVLWAERFARQPDVIGKYLYASGHRYRVAGVLADGFVFPDDRVQLWLPLAFSEADRSMENAGSFGDVRAIALLRAGQTVEGASQQMNAVVARHPMLGMVATQIGLQLRAEPVRELWLKDRRGSLLKVLAGALLVLGVTIANVYTLFLLRCFRRRQEGALLQVAGAPRGRLRLQVALEAGLLALAGVVLAVAVLPIGLDLLRQLDVMPKDMPHAVRLDGAVLIFVACVWALVTAVLASSSHALSSGNISQVLRQTGNGQTGSRAARYLRTGVVVGQLVVSLVLVFSAALLMRSSSRLIAEDIGFDRSALVVGTLRVTGEESQADPAKARAQMASWLNRLSDLPGVEDAGFTNSAPFGQVLDLEAVDVPGRAQGPGEDDKAYVASVSPSYLTTMGVERLRGRAFTSAEANEAAPVAIIDDAFAKRYFGQIDPVGQTIRVAENGGAIAVSVIGVVRTLRQRALDRDDDYPFLYRPMAVPFAAPGIPTNSVDFVLRTSDPHRLAALIRDWDSGLPGLRIAQVATMGERIDDTIADLIRLAAMFKILAILAVLLTACGLYAVLAHSVATRSREFAVRQALGATRGRVLRDVLREGGALAAIAASIGTPLALLAESLLRPKLHEAPPVDVVALIGVGLALGVIVLAANAVPAVRASRTNPMLALRSE